MRNIIISVIFLEFELYRKMHKKCMKMMHEIIYNCFCKSKLKIMMQKIDATKEMIWLAIVNEKRLRKLENIGGSMKMQ